MNGTVEGSKGIIQMPSIPPELTTAPTILNNKVPNRQLGAIPTVQHPKILGVILDIKENTKFRNRF